MDVSVRSLGSGVLLQRRSSVLVHLPQTPPPPRRLVRERRPESIDVKRDQLLLPVSVFAYANAKV